MICLQAFERCDDILLIHLHRVGDHTRGLFEAEASVAASAAHALHDGAIFGVHETRLVLRELELGAHRALRGAQCAMSSAKGQGVPTLCIVTTTD